MALTKVGKEGITGISNASDATFLTATSSEGVTLAGTLAVTGVHTVGNNALYTSDAGAVTQNLVQGLLKAWSKVDGESTATVNDSFNISGITDNGTGNYTLAMTNAMNVNTYSQTHGANGTQQQIISATTGAYRLEISNSGGTAGDVNVICSKVAGDLA
tara:strand:- start:72 stop:548 length:477 start_codon:yes stop_codon:yes gene_type:complete